MNTPRSQPGGLRLAMRLACYALTTGLVLDLVVRRARAGAISDWVVENGPIELAHALLAFAAACVLLAGARRQVANAALRALLGLACMFAGVRELDGFFGETLGPNSYKAFAAPIVFAAAAVAWRARRSLPAEVQEFLATPAAALVFAGALVVLVHAQVLGQKELWQALVPEPGARVVKKTVEECSELTGYLLLLFAAIEVELLGRS